jgi:uncharacterized DUF497 family protein
MGSNDRCSWDDGKRELNLQNHGYDFADVGEVFDGRFVVTRQDRRFEYGEDRYNMLVELYGRVINVTFTPRGDRMHLISVRPASREERSVYHARRRAS